MMNLVRSLLFLPQSASTFAERHDQLHFFVVGTTMFVSAAVAIVTAAFFFIYRRKSENESTPFVYPSLGIEAAFVAVPLGFFLLWFVIGFKDFVWSRSPPKDAMDVYVMGKQWMWKFTYPNGPNAISTLHVPAHRPVRLLMTSRDVIHSFFVPEFRVKQDVLPGRYSELWFEATVPGRYQVLCTEYCGLNHSLMRGDIVVMEPEDFDKWYDRQHRGLIERQDSTLLEDEPMAKGSNMREQGEKVAVAQGCLKCHSVNGDNHIGPTWLDLYGRHEKLTTGEAVLADEAYLTSSMMDPMAQIVAGYQPVMPSYQGRLTAPESAALVEYIKSLTTERTSAEASKGPAYESIPGR